MQPVLWYCKDNNICYFKQNKLYLFLNTNIMGKAKSILLPKQQRTLDGVGEQIKLARLRRDLSAEQVAERAGIGRSTLVKLEKGDPGVAIGSLLKVLFVLGLDGDLAKVAQDDLLGRRLQDLQLTAKERASKTPKK